MRVEGYPFDWCITPLLSVIELLNNRFDDFFNEDNFVYLPKEKRILLNEAGESESFIDDYVTPVYDSKYHMMYVHDFGERGSKDYQVVREKYLRRAKRLLNLLDSAMPIEFVFENNPLNNWQAEQYRKVNHEFQLLDDMDKLNPIQKDSISFVSLSKLKEEVK